MPLGLTLSIRRRIEINLFSGTGIGVVPALTNGVAKDRRAFGSLPTAVDLFTLLI